MRINETMIKLGAIGILRELGYANADADRISPDNSHPERLTYAEPVLHCRLEVAVARIIPDIPEEARGAAIRQVLRAETASLFEENRRFHRLMVDGVDVEYRAEDGTIRGDKVWLVDYADPIANN
jgi:type I restriction enzyme, R subunit